MRWTAKGWQAYCTSSRTIEITSANEKPRAKGSYTVVGISTSHIYIYVGKSVYHRCYSRMTRAGKDR